MTDVLGRAVYVYEADTGPLEKSTAAAKTTVDRAGAQMQASMDKRLAGVSKSMGKVGSTMSRNVTLPIIGLGGAAVKMAADFDAAMERVHTQSGASQKEVDKLRGSVLALAKTSTQSPTDLANALYRLEGAGYRGQKAMDALRASSHLAAVGNADVEDTTKTLTQVMKPGIKGVKDFHDAVAQVNATVGAGDMRLQQLVDALGTGIVTSAKQAGLSFRDVRGALAVFGDETNNVSGWSAQFATALHFLTNPTAKAANALNGIGIKSDQLAQDMQKPNGLVRALRDLQDHLDQTFPKGSGAALSIDQQRQAMDKYETTLKSMGVTGSTLSKDMDKYKQKLQDYGSAAVAQTDTLGDIFPGGRGRVLSVLLNQVDLLQQKIHQEDNTTKNFSKAVQATNEQAATKIKKAWSTLQVDAIQLGDALGPDFIKVGETVANEADKIATAFMKLSPDARQMIITGGLITAGIGPAMKIASVFLGGVGKLMTAAKTAEKLAAGEKTLFGGTAAKAAGTGGLTGMSRVATMEVAELNVARMLGAPGAGGTGAWPMTGSKTGPKAPPAETIPVAPVAEEASLGTMLKGTLSKIAGAGMIAGGGVVASQIVGNLVGGKVGSQISTLGTGASIGGGLGTMIAGPVGAGIGAGVGAGVAEAVKWVRGQDYGKKVADSMTIGFGGQFGQNLKGQIATNLDDAHRLLSTTHTVTPGSSPVAAARFGPGAGRTGPSVTDTAPSARDVAQANRDYEKAGREAAQALERGWSQYKFKSEPEMFAQFTSETRQLAPQAQAAALEATVKFSQGLESKGQLVKGSTKQLIADVENEFPGLKKYMGLSAQSSVQTFAKALDFQNAENDTKKAMNKIADHFQAVKVSMDSTKGDTVQKAGAMVRALEGIVQNGSAPMRKQATRDLNQLRDSLTGDFQKMGSVTTSKMADIRSAVQSGSQGAAKAAGRYWDQFKTIIQSAEQAGAISVAQGNKIIGQQLAKALKALGLSTKDADALAKQGWSVGQVSTAISSAKQAGYGSAQGTRNLYKAQGGLVQIGRPGDTGRDTIPLQFGDQAYMVGSGEQAMILNRSQQAFLNARTADVGGLPGMFQRVNRPHYRAQGGFLGKPMAAGGMFTGQPTLSQAQLAQLWIAAGGPPSMAHLMSAIAEAESGGRDVVNSIGATGYWQIHPGGSQYLDPMTNARTAVEKYRSQGLSAWTTYTNGAYRAFMNGSAVPAGALGGMGISVPTLNAPQVKGTGAIAALVQGVLDQTTAAANKYLTGKTSAMAGVGGPASVGAAGAPGFDPSQLGTYDGKSVADWIIPELEWARAHGWGGTVTSGWRSPTEVVHGVFATAPQGQSEHQYDIYPGGAVDVSDYQQFASIIAGYPGADKLIQLGIDPLHFSGTGHAKGGILSRLAGGGFIKLPYESKLQDRFSKATDIMRKLWKAGASLYHRGGSHMPNVTYTQGADGLFVGTDFSGRAGHRQVFWPDWFVNGQKDGKHFDPGIQQYAPSLLETVIHEWVHEFQTANDSKLNSDFQKLFPTATSKVGLGFATEGGAQGFAKLFGPRLIRQALGINDTAGPERPSDLYYQPIQYVKKYLGDEWIKNGQFGVGPLAHKRLMGTVGAASKGKGPKVTPSQQAFVSNVIKKTGVGKGKKPTGGHKAKPKHPKKPQGVRGGIAASGIAKGLMKGVIGRDGPFPFDTRDLEGIRGTLSQILALDGGDSGGIGAGTGGDAQRMWDLISWYTGTVWPGESSPNWDDAGDPANFVVTTDAHGNDFTTTDVAGNTIPDPSRYYISPNLNRVVSELTKAIGWQGQGVTDLQKVMGLTAKARLPRFIQEAIHRRVQMIARIRKRIQENAEKIRRYKEAVKRLQKQVKETREKMTKGVLYLHPKTYGERQANHQFHQEPYPNISKTRPYPKPKNARQRAANQTWEQHAAANRTWKAIHNQQYESWHGQVSGWDKQIKHYNRDLIKPLEKENNLLGGSPDKIGAGGELKTLRTQLGSKAGSDPMGLALGTASSSSGLYSLLDTIQGWRTAIGGTGGDLAVQKGTLKGWQGNLAGLAPGASSELQYQIGQANQTIKDTESTAGGGSSASDTTSQLDSIKAQLYDQLQQSGQVSALQSGAFSPLLTSAGSPVEWIKQAGLIGAIPPYGGSFYHGGIIPGAMGEPRVVVAHGGERYLGVGNDFPDQPIVVQVHNHGAAKELMQFVDTRISVASRTSARKVSYGLPSRGGGR